MSFEENFFRDRTAYDFAIEVGNYRAAARLALNRMRYDPGEVWAFRLRGAFTRRNR